MCNGYILQFLSSFQLVDNILEIAIFLLSNHRLNSYDNWLPWKHSQRMIDKTVLAFFPYHIGKPRHHGSCTFSKNEIRYWSKRTIIVTWEVASGNPRTVSLCNMYIVDCNNSDTSTASRSLLKRIWNDQLSSILNSIKMANEIFVGES